MATITYRATFQTPNDVVTDLYRVKAKSINTGVSKALQMALHGLPKDWEFVSIEFWESTHTTLGR